MRILIVSDAWLPQVNGVVHTLRNLSHRLEALGHPVRIVNPSEFRSIPCPTYPEIRLSLPSQARLGAIVHEFKPDAVHLATEGPLGISFRAFCRKHRLPFTTSFLSRFPEYIHARFRLPLSLTYRLLRRFHKPSAAIMVASQSMEEILSAQGFQRLKRWTRGVDTELFRPRDKGFLQWPRPILLYVGRIAVEKNIEAFLRLDVAGTKVVVGDGPQRRQLEASYPLARFVGAKFGEELASHYAAADVLVFPSRTDVFGNVQLEALACGVPVAAYPVTGAIDIIGLSGAGVLDADLGRAVSRALPIPSERCRSRALEFSWDTSIRQFLSNLHPV